MAERRKKGELTLADNTYRKTNDRQSCSLVLPRSGKIALSGKGEGVHSRSTARRTKKGHNSKGLLSVLRTQTRKAEAVTGSRKDQGRTRREASVSEIRHSKRPPWKGLEASTRGKGKKGVPLIYEGNNSWPSMGIDDAV